MKKKRPANWSKEAALEWAKAHPGATLPDVARAFATAECPWPNLGYDLHCFRGEDAAFRAEFDQLVPLSNRGAGQDLDAPPDLDDWKLRWARHYLETEDKIEASARVGMSWSTVQTYLRPRHRNFDQGFKDLVDQVESWLVASDEADLRLAARIARDSADARTLAWIALERLGRVDREKWGKTETIHHKGEVEHRHVVELRDAGAELAKRTALLFAPRALPAPPVEITLPPEAVKVVGSR